MIPYTAKQNEPILVDLMVGFEALTRKVDELVARNAALEKELKLHTQQQQQPQHQQGTNDLTTAEPSRRSSGQPSSTAPTSVSEWRENDCFAPGIEAWKRLKEMRGRNVDSEKLERDFTTQGRVGDLRCPFSQRAARRLSRGTASSLLRAGLLSTPPPCIKEETCVQDPIAAEFHPTEIGSAPASVQNSTSKCPIRYLDDHSPEEVAKYFENHKHEIPRSHEVCVKRYQADGESVRQLDAKYGNLVNMIQGLGVKHQPLLPADEEENTDQKSMDQVERWAETCAENAVPPAEDDKDTESDIRTGHFERPEKLLHEVRLGESPSRPWGIQVPFDKQIAVSDRGSVDSNAAQSIAAAAAESQPAPALREPVKQCPFSQFRAKDTAIQHGAEPPVNHTTKAPQATTVTNNAQPATETKASKGIVFNGPVFFGYPASEIETILRGMQAST